MALYWKTACLEDMEALVASRVMVLRAANMLSDQVDLSEVERQSREYYEQALPKDAHVALLVYDGDTLVGTGGVSFYRVMPTCDNPSGWKAYIMNMYTAPARRRQGIARKTLALLVAECHRRGIGFVTLEATDAGRPLYERFGFVSMGNEMILSGEFANDDPCDD